MRVLVICKRQYTGKDLLDDRYGRLYEIPEVLASHGHDIRGLTLSYRRRAQGAIKMGKVEWVSTNRIPDLPVYCWRLARTLKIFQPDVVWVSSDVYQAIFAWQFCRRLEIPFVIDMYDNYESFFASRVPGVVSLFRAACRAASGLTLVSSSLDRFVAENYGVRCTRQVVGNAVRKDIFRPRPKQDARKALGLPENSKIIGTAGAITAGRGIELLFEAFLRLAEQDPDLWLVYAGPRDETPSRYCSERIIDLGELPYDRVPDVFNALDVAVICNLDSWFGRYCFPQKLYEIVACGTPLVVAAVGDVATLLAPWPETLFEPGSVESLTKCLGEQLLHPSNVELDVPGWDDSASQLESLLVRVVG
jgi:glycosyltransferase involved in cell wall biosynthesis